MVTAPRLCPLCKNNAQVRVMPIPGVATVFMCEACFSNPTLREKILLRLIDLLHQYAGDPKIVGLEIAALVREYRLIEPLLTPPPGE